MTRTLAFAVVALTLAACRPADAPPAPAGHDETNAPQPSAAHAQGDGSGSRTVLDTPRAPITDDPGQTLVGVWHFDEAGTRAASDSPWLQALPAGAEGRWTFDPLSDGSGDFLESWTFGPEFDPLDDAAGTWQITAVDAALGTVDFVAIKQLPEMPDVTETITATAHFDGADTIVVTTVAAPEVPSVWRRAPNDDAPGGGAP